MNLGRWVLSFALGLLPAFQGCSNVAYYAQSVNGHLNIVSAGQSVDRLIVDPTPASELKEQLKLARDIRSFASDRLSLPDNKSYRNYVDTGREYATWSVFAAQELSLDVRNWCFPVVGCVPYRGYFSREAATKFAQGVKGEGLDVYVGGVPAYSTLGLFDDPLLNTMFRHGDTYLAGVVFHELSHQRIYVANDTRFNEAFAVSVERAGTEAWLRKRGKVSDIRNYDRSRRHNEDFLALVAQSREDLKDIYSRNISDAEKRRLKEAAIERLRDRYRQMKAQRWNGYDGYDLWFSEPINNAKLATVAVYNDLVPAFRRLLRLCSHDFTQYYQAVERIAELDKEQRVSALMEAESCV